MKNILLIVSFLFFSVGSYAALPPNTGTLSLCVGVTTSLSNPVAGGTWSSSAAGVATVSAGTGIVGGVSAGTAIITYTDGVDFAYSTVTVNPAIGAISGVLAICNGSTSLLSCIPAGGTWSSSSPVVAFIGASTGIVTPVSAGTTTVTYTIGTGCFSTAVVTVNPAPSSITGTASLCAGLTTTLTSTPGGTWSSLAPGVATVSTGGVVYGAGLGTATISYSMGVCGVSQVVTVSSACAGTPVPGAITASASLVCSGTAVVLDLPVYTYQCGHTIQWQYSADGFSWSNLAGAATVPYTFYPTGNYYYRCGITCASGGASASSGPVHVSVNFSIGSHSVIPTPAGTCDPTDFYISACGVSTTFSVKTYFGDGLSATVPLSASGVSEAHVYHPYVLPGIYTVKQVLFNGTMAVDSVSFSYTNSFCNALPIQYYLDNNTNCVFDAGDVANMVPVMTRVDSNGIAIDTISSTSGFVYQALGVPGTVYGFTNIAVGGGMVITCPSSGTIYDTIAGTLGTYLPKYFGMQCDVPTSFDLKVTSTATTGRHTQVFNMVVTNHYCTSMSPVLTFTFSPKYGYYPTYTGTSPAPTSVVGNVATWNMAPMAANTTRNVALRLERPYPLPFLPVGDSINSIITVSPSTGDLNPGNNTNIRVDTVKASYDPNDIAVAPAGYILPCTELEYRVRFENTGNDTAHNIYVVDTLPAGVDPTSMEIISASHIMNLSVINTGLYHIAKFDFPNIMLPDTSHHELSSGMFVFKIKTYNTLADGTDIMNRVGIYFDDNEVVMTNEVNNKIGIAPITGPGHICLGYPDTLANTTPGGLWTSSVPATATISPLGIVTPIVAGTTEISYTVTNSCTSRTASREFTVNPIVASDVSITVSTADTICSGIPVIYTAAPVYGGDAPAYTWMVNGVVSGFDTSFTYLPAAGDTVILSMTSNQACTIPSWAADTVSLTVISMAMPVASLSVSPGSTSCAGTPVAFTTTPAFGGSSPGYSWYVNGLLSGSGVTYIYVPTTGDVIYCRMGSNFMCRLADTVNSGSIHMTVDPFYVPVISIAASPGLGVAIGELITLTASVINGGPSPAYQWYVNGTLIPSATTSVFSSNTLSDYDSVTCRVTGSGVCSIVSYNYVYVSVSPAGVHGLASGDALHLFPNPNNGSFRVKGMVGNGNADAASISVSNLIGQTVYNGTMPIRDGKVDEAVLLPANLPAGVYMLQVRTEEGTQAYRFVLDK